MAFYVYFLGCVRFYGYYSSNLNGTVHWQVCWPTDMDVGFLMVCGGNQIHFIGN